MPYESYFMIDVPSMLKRLESDTQPQWGSMTAYEMLDHLRKGVDICVLQLPSEIITPQEMLPKYKDFLMSDKPFRPGSAKPAVFDEVAALEGDLEMLKVNLMKSLVNMMVHFEKYPDHRAVHAYFGELNTQEWLQMHYKHIQHHFTQFGLT